MSAGNPNAVKVTYVLPTGEEREVQVGVGLNVMLGATTNNIDGIHADCGGTLSCATCHVYVDRPWVERLPQPDAAELGLLEGVVAELKPSSRLSCQLNVTPELEGLKVFIPDRQ
jgi:2Fe-2S ferredoxin